MTKGTRDVVSRAFEYWRTVTEALQRSFRVAVDQLLGESSVVVDLCGGLKLTDRALDGLIYCALYALLTGLKADPEVRIVSFLELWWMDAASNSEVPGCMGGRLLCFFL